MLAVFLCQNIDAEAGKRTHTEKYRSTGRQLWIMVVMVFIFLKQKFMWGGAAAVLYTLAYKSRK